MAACFGNGFCDCPAYSGGCACDGGDFVAHGELLEDVVGDVGEGFGEAGGGVGFFEGHGHVWKFGRWLGWVGVEMGVMLEVFERFLNGE